MLSGTGKDGNIAVGFRLVWTQIKIHFQAIATAHDATDESFLLAQPLDRAGFHKDGSQPKSVTHAVTMELEERRAHDLDVRLCNNLLREAHERWSWEANTSLSGAFLLSPPNQLGFIEDPVFQVALTTYLGQSCPLMGPLVG